MTTFLKQLLLVFAIVPLVALSVNDPGIRIKNLGRIDGVRDNMIAGYGIVSGLSGTGDSSRSKATLQSVNNALREFGVTVDVNQLNSRNVAAVLVTATLPAFARPGDKIDVHVSSVGDARSLSGGTLLMAPLYGPDKKVYVLAQGPLAVGSYQFSLNGSLVQKNHPTAGVISEGGTVERGVASQILKGEDRIDLVLFEPDYTTANRISETINSQLGDQTAQAVDAGRIRITVPEKQRSNLVQYVARLESITVSPDQRARVIINERTGTVVAGGDVRLSSVTITQGSLRVSIVTDFQVSQPNGVLISPTSAIRTEVVPQTRIDVKEEPMRSVSLPAGTRVAELVDALNRIKTNTRDMIAVLQSMRRAGALHAELVVQ